VELKIGMIKFQSFLSALLVLTTLSLIAVHGVKLQIADSECVEQNIKEAASLVSVVLVAGLADDLPVYFDFVVRSSVIISE
jgi:hypothetical protein